MPNEAKRETVARLREELSRSRALVVSEYRGLKVKEIGEIRSALRSRGIRYRVVKNRLMRIAAGDGPAGEALSRLLTGPTAIAFGTDEAATAKAVIEAIRPYRVVRVTGAVVGGQAIDAEGVQRLAMLPSREVLLAEVAGTIGAPLATTLGLIDAPLRELAGLLQALADRKAAAA